MTNFDKKYYEDIWGTIHRHDYCESLANFLILKYGKVRILDCGTGCGHLVKVLREKGCDAWGFDVSDYALENCCAPGYVVKAHASRLPFADNSFDVVHSNGLLGYDENVDDILKELNRVGKIQHHNIDYEDNIPEHQYTIKENKLWWDKKLEKYESKILVACTVHKVKDYGFQKWIDNVKSFTYPNIDIFVVDNSPDGYMYEKYKDQINIVHLKLDDKYNVSQQWLNRICRSMAEVQRFFLKGNYTHWMNVEADNYPPKDVIENLLKYGQDADWSSHCYNVLPEQENLQQGIGCSLLSRRIMTDFNWDDETVANDSPDSELWTWVQQQKKYKVVELWYVMNVLHEHLNQETN